MILVNHLQELILFQIALPVDTFLQQERVQQTVEHIVLGVLVKFFIALAAKEQEPELAQGQTAQRILRQTQNLAALLTVVLGVVGHHLPQESKKGQELVLEQIVAHILSQKLDVL